MRQVKFKDLENNEVHGGILTDDGDIICGCCGGLIEADEIAMNVESITDETTYVILCVYHTWVNLDEEICGDDLYEE